MNVKVCMHVSISTLKTESLKNLTKAMLNVIKIEMPLASKTMHRKPQEKTERSSRTDLPAFPYQPPIPPSVDLPPYVLSTGCYQP